jgi:hypothetical protein
MKEFRAWVAVASVLMAGFADSAAGPVSPCVESFRQVVSKVQADYSGYLIEIKPNLAKDAAYEALVKLQTARATHASRDECFEVLRYFASWFHDPHLFVIEAPKFSADQLLEFRSQVRFYRGDIDALTRAANGGSQDPIEGLWSGEKRGIAIVRDGATHDFIAVMLDAGDSVVAKGEIIGRFHKTPADYDAVLYKDDKSPRRHTAALERNVFLHMPPNTWERRAPLSDMERRLIDPADPRGPAFTVLDKQVAILSIPSFSPEHQDQLNALINKNLDEITARPVLIVDLRGNEGGSSGLGDLLAPLYYALPLKPEHPKSGFPVVLSSADTQENFEFQLKDQTPGPYRTMILGALSRMQASPGELVPLTATDEEKAARGDNPPPDKTYPQPSKVAFLIDRHSISAAEAVVISARRSPRVTVFGHNSGGSIDYESVNMVPFGAGAWRYYVGYPVIASSNHLPIGGYNRMGVPVDVPINLAKEDPYAFIARYYSSRGSAAKGHLPISSKVRDFPGKPRTPSNP